MDQIKTGELIRTLRTEQGFTRRLRKSSVAAIGRCRNGNAAAARPMEHGHPISFPAGDTLPLKRLHKKKRRGNVAFREEMKRKTTAGAAFGEKTFRRMSGVLYEKRTVRMGTVRFVQRVCDTRRSREELLSRKGASFASFLLNIEEKQCLLISGSRGSGSPAPAERSGRPCG